MAAPADGSYLEYVAWQATRGIVGGDAAIPGGELYEGILRGLRAEVDAAYERGLGATMIQLSLVHDGARVVG